MILTKRGTFSQRPRSAALACAAALLWCASAHAQLDWAVISTAGDPDPVTIFDLASPGSSNMLLGNVDGNFNRGMDFDSPNSFYYFVSTDALNSPGDRGLWRWDNNVNTQLATIDFSDSGDGDATLSNDFSRFFVAVDDQDATSGDSLYVFDNLGGAVTFAEIGEIGLSQIIGMATDPVSGLIYAYDSSTEGLYTIDATSAAPTLVGSSGLNLGAIGGMDFSADGSTLLLASGNDLFLVDKGTGALSPAGDVIVNTSALSYRAIPEPATGLLALIVATFVCCVRRR